MRGYAAIGLHCPKDRYNVGATLRAAGVFSSALVAVSGRRLRRSPTDTMCAYRHLPLIHCDSLFDVLPYDCVPVAVELLPSASSLITYAHPERAFYIFGPEDGTLGQSITSRCRDIIYVPTARCMNLAATVNVVLYDRLAKSHKGTTNGLPSPPLLG